VEEILDHLYATSFIMITRCMSSTIYVAKFKRYML